MRLLHDHSSTLLLLQSENCYHETSINIYTVKLHVPSPAILKSKYKEQRNRKCKCKSQQFLQLGNAKYSTKICNALLTLLVSIKTN